MGNLVDMDNNSKWIKKLIIGDYSSHSQLSPQLVSAAFPQLIILHGRTL